MPKRISQNEFSDLILPMTSRETGKMTYNHEYGNMTTDYFSTGLGITYYHNRAKFYEDTIIEERDQDKTTFLCFNTGNSLAFEDATGKHPITFEANMCGGAQKQGGHNEMYCKNKQYALHYVVFDDELSKKLFLNNKNVSHLEVTESSYDASMGFSARTTYHQTELLTNLLQVGVLQDKLQEIYLESKLLDLVHTTIQGIGRSYENKLIYLSSQDIQGLEKARAILLEDLANPPSIAELAHKVAMNEFKLKKGFKQYFKTTIYGLLQEHRLTEAKKLLEEGDININEVSNLVGYKQASHFSVVFKKYFGVTPIEIKKKSQRYYY